MDVVQQIIDNLLQSFDFGYCLVVNIATYIIIKIIDEVNKEKKVSTLVKRIVLTGVIAATSILYYYSGVDTKILINSSILAPVSWSWIFKPICKHFGIDYKKIEDTNN